MHNYTPLVLAGMTKEATNIIKPTETRINREKYTFCVIKSLDLIKKFKKWARPLLKVHKNENYFGFDFEFCTISMLVMHK